MLLEIVTYGNPALREKSKQVETITDEIRKLVADMLETMYADKGVGLAAEQVGRTERLCVIDVPSEIEKEAHRKDNAPIAMPLVMINPEIISLEGRQRNEEGCLSFPGIGAPVTRADKVTFSYQNLEGERITATAYGLLARAVQHETDHLNGVLFVDKLSSLQKMAISGQLKRLRRSNEQ